MDYEPISVALKFGFLAVLYLFLLWVARSAMKDLARSGSGEAAAERFQVIDAEGRIIARLPGPVTSLAQLRDMVAAAR